MLGKKIRDLRLYGLGKQRARTLPQDFGELIVKASWLNQLQHVIVRHGISLLQWRSGGLKHPHDMPPFRFAPSPTSGDSSVPTCAVHKVVSYRRHWRRAGRTAAIAVFDPTRRSRTSPHAAFPMIDKQPG